MPLRSENDHAQISMLQKCQSFKNLKDVILSSSECDQQCAPKDALKMKLLIHDLKNFNQ